MAIEYRLTLDGTIPVEQVAERALPEPRERPTGTPPLLSVNLNQRYGFALTIRAGQNGYLEVESDHGMWEWEPQDYVAVTFRLDNEADTQWAVVDMLTIVRRLLESGPEDATLVLNGDYLLFRRVHGALIKHRESWWDNYNVANML